MKIKMTRNFYIYTHTLQKDIIIKLIKIIYSRYLKYIRYIDINMPRMFVSKLTYKYEQNFYLINNV